MTETVNVASRWPKPIRIAPGVVLAAAKNGAVATTEKIDAAVFAKWLATNGGLPAVASGAVYQVKGDEASADAEPATAPVSSVVAPPASAPVAGAPAAAVLPVSEPKASPAPVSKP